MKMQTKNPILLVVFTASIIMLLLLSACNNTGATLGGAVTTTDALDRILKEGKIKIAVPQDTPLFGIQGSDGSYEGFDVDFAHMLAEDLGVELELVPVVSANRIPFLTSGKVDLVIANMGVRPDRAEVIAFSKPYAPFFWAVYGTKDVDVRTIEDTVPYTVGATLGTLEEIAFSAAAPAGTKILRYNDQATTVQSFLSGQVDLIVTGNAIAAEVIRQNPAKGIESKFVLRQSPCHIGVRKGDNGLLSWVNAAVYVHKLNGDLDTLSIKWFGEPLPEFPDF
jgi:polar amino acid transport system substrate-binding protein